MAKKSRHVRLFVTVARVRLQEAAFLHANDFTMGAVYLAGYAVECLLKALVLDCHLEHEQPAAVDTFRGGLAHDYGWLLQRYRAAGGPPLPAEVAKAFGLLRPWGTELRYNPRTQYPGDADQLLDAVDVVKRWVEGRL